AHGRQELLRGLLRHHPSALLGPGRQLLLDARIDHYPAVPDGGDEAAQVNGSDVDGSLSDGQLGPLLPARLGSEAHPCGSRTHAIAPRVRRGPPEVAVESLGRLTG